MISYHKKSRPRGHPMRPYKETALGNPLRNHSDKAQSSRIDLRVQGEPDQLTEDEEQKNSSLIQSLLMNILQSVNEDKVIADLIVSKER